MPSMDLKTTHRPSWSWRIGPCQWAGVASLLGREVSYLRVGGRALGVGRIRDQGANCSGVVVVEVGAIGSDESGRWNEGVPRDGV